MDNALFQDSYRKPLWMEVVYFSNAKKKNCLKLAQLVCNLFHCTGNQNIDQFCSLQSEL